MLQGIITFLVFAVTFIATSNYTTSIIVANICGTITVAIIFAIFSIGALSISNNDGVEELSVTMNMGIDAIHRFFKDISLFSTIYGVYLIVYFLCFYFVMIAPIFWLLMIGADIKLFKGWKAPPELE